MLDLEYPLTKDQIGSYRKNGFICLRKLASAPDIAFYRPKIQTAVAQKLSQDSPVGEKKAYGRYFGQVTNVWQLDAGLQPLIFAKRFARIAAKLMGVSGVRLYHDQALFKQAGGRNTPWHQDQFYWPLDTVHTVTLWMPLTDTPRESGTMSFAAGSQHEGSLMNIAISDESQTRFDELVAERKFPVKDFSLHAGDATFHSGWTVHSAHGNSSEATREVITIIYYANGTRLMDPDSENRRVDMEVFHPGQKAGEVAASPLNPLLYP
jgi:ectoine hydroxylase-related dioxygenase (phytanoyl-CoA dioxygenase family)